MNPTRENYYRNLFRIASLYDVLLGVVFACFPARAFNLLGIGDKLPAFGGYLALPGAFVLVVGIAYFLISRGDLQRNSDLILVGTLYKLAYATVAFYYWGAGSLPHVIFAAVFGVADAAFFFLMAECWWFLRKTARA